MRTQDRLGPKGWAAYMREWYRKHRKRWREIDVASKARRAVLGQCKACGKPALEDMDQCFLHWFYTVLRTVQLRPLRGWTDRSRRLRHLLAMHVYGRFDAVRSGQQEPISLNEATIVAFSIRREFGIAWGGTGGAEKLAKALYRVEQKAKELR